MTNPKTAANFRDLAGAAMRCTVQMLAELSPETNDSLVAAVHGGARLVLEFGPLPGFTSATLMLVEREGHRRHKVAAISLNDRAANDAG
jgi:hypothetical protein